MRSGVILPSTSGLGVPTQPITPPRLGRTRERADDVLGDRAEELFGGEPGREAALAGEVDGVHDLGVAEPPVGLAPAGRGSPVHDHAVVHLRQAAHPHQPTGEVVVLEPGVEREALVEPQLARGGCARHEVAAIQLARRCPVADEVLPRRPRERVDGDGPVDLAGRGSVHQDAPGQALNVGVGVEELHGPAQVVGPQHGVVVEEGDDLDLGWEHGEAGVALGSQAARAGHHLPSRQQGPVGRQALLVRDGHDARVGHADLLRAGHKRLTEQLR